MSRAGEVGLRDGGFVKPCFGGAELSHTFSFQFQAVCAVNQPVQHGVGDRGVADVLVPAHHRHLTGDDGGCPIVPVIDDLHQIAALLGGERRDRPIVQDQQLHPRQVLQHAAVTSVAASHAEAFE